MWLQLLLTGLSALLMLHQTQGALPYPHDVICNNGTSHACICYQADQSMREYYSDCEVFMKPNVDISVVVLQFSGLNLNGHTYNGDPYETQFKNAVASIISTHCQKHAQECPGTMLPVEPDRIILMSIDCQGANNEQTRVTFVVTQNKNSFQIAPWFILDAGLIVRILTVQQRKLSQAVGNMRIQHIYPEVKVKATVPYPTDSTKSEEDGATTQIKKGNPQNRVLVIILSGIGCSLCVCYVIAIYKVCVDYHQRKRQEKEKQSEEKDQLNNGQPTAYGAIGEDNNNANNNQVKGNNAAVTMIITSESFSNKQQQQLQRKESQTSIKSDQNRQRSQPTSSKRSSASSVNSKSSDTQIPAKVTHKATINRSQESDPAVANEKSRRRTESGSSPLPYEDTGYYIPEPQPMPPTPPDQTEQPNDVNVIDNPMATAAAEEEYNQYSAPMDANGYSYGYYNEHNYDAAAASEWNNASDSAAAATDDQQHYYDNYTYTAEDGTVYYWDGEQWQYMYPEQIPQEPLVVDTQSASSTSTPPVYSTPPCVDTAQAEPPAQDESTPVDFGPPPSVPPPPLPSRPRPAPQPQRSIDSNKSIPNRPPSAQAPVHSMQQAALGKSVSLRSVQRLQKEASVTSTDGAHGHAAPLEPLLESARSATLTDVRKKPKSTADSDLSSDSDTDDESPTENAQQPATTRVVPYHQMAPSLTPMQSMEQPDVCNTINPVAAAPPSTTRSQLPARPAPPQPPAPAPTCPPLPQPAAKPQPPSLPNRHLCNSIHIVRISCAALRVNSRSS